MPSSTPLALFVGMPGLELSADEVAFFREANPYGLFLFKRNFDTPDQIRRLCAQFREAVGREDAPVFTDQEGGRVQRLDNGNWPRFRPLGDFGKLAEMDLDLGLRAVRLSSRAMGSMLADLTIDSGTSPVVDLVRSYTSAMLGNRAMSEDPEIVIAMGNEILEGLQETGILPIIKHVPGYGRVEVDAHLECPIVDTPLEEMQATDFKPFMALKSSPWAMVAHTIYTAIDPDTVASISPKVCALIRKDIGYDGVLISDCVTMEALSGPWPERVTAVLDAGYDIALHSQGNLTATQAAAKAARPLSVATLSRLEKGNQRLGTLKVDVEAIHAKVEDIFINSGIAS